MNKENLKFLKELSEELKTQSNDHCADPVYWVLAQYEWHPCWEDQAEEIHYADNEGNDFKTFEELLAYVKEEYPDEDFSEASDWDEFNSEYGNFANEYHEVPLKREQVIINGPLFLTKSDAQKHIEMNSYRYNDTVHTYGMTAFRSPVVEKLLKIIKEEKWELEDLKRRTIGSLQKEVHQNAVDHGWWDDGDRNFGELIALCHSELSEALESYRSDPQPVNENRYREGDGKPEGVPSELADVVIRLMDMCERLGIDLEKFVIEKHEFNKTRPYRHGNKKI